MKTMRKGRSDKSCSHWVFASVGALDKSNLQWHILDHFFALGQSKNSLPFK